MLESEPQRVLEAQQQKYIEEQQNGKAIEASHSPTSPSPKSPNGGGSSKKHKKNKPSYADVAANKATAQGTSQVLPPTRLPPTAHLAKDLGIPSRPNPLHLFFGLPSNSKKFNYLSLAINTILILLCLDFQFTPKLFLDVKDTTFVRVGAVSDNSAKLVARVPKNLFPVEAIHSSLHTPENMTLASNGHEIVEEGAAGLSGSVLDSIIIEVDHSAQADSAGVTTIPTNSGANTAKLVYRASRAAGAWHLAGSLSPSPDTDYVSTIELKDLLPNTEYEYALILPESAKDKFVTPNVEHPYHFKTSPDYKLSIHQTHFTFAATSCIKQNFPYAPGQDHLSVKGATELADRIGPDHIEFLMFMGDFIYADVPWKTRSADGYYKLYRQNFASSDYKRIYENIPTYHIYDDHEIVNDYAGQSNDSDPFFQMAAPAYTAYLGNANPTPSVPGVNYYSMSYGDVAFFVWDTRRYRSANEAIDDEEKTMLGSQQKEIFLDWLKQVNGTHTFKFVVSSVPFQTCYGGPNGKFDTWGGFQTERSELMDVMQYVPNVIVLSGDRHEFAAVSIRETVIDFCIGPLNQFSLPIRTLSQKSGLCATGEDKILKYIPDGYRKFSTFEVDTRNPEQPIVTLKLWVDGKEAWNVDVIGKPVYPPAQDGPVTQLGKSLAFSLAELLGLGRRWF